MIKIVLSGCGGKMGRVIASCIEERNDCTVIAGFDVNQPVLNAFPVFTNPRQCEDLKADVIIDFSHPAMLSALLEYAQRTKTPAVIATTGLTPEQIEEISAASKKIPVFFSANMSLGVNLLVELAKKATAVLSKDFDIEIIEKHHNQKIDAPSGTALMIADNISNILPTEPRYVYDRHSVRRKRDKNEIGIHAVRGGTIVGEHEVIFAGNDEIITLTHTAMSKNVFATGSINAALFLAKQKPGLYNMGDLV